MVSVVSQALRLFPQECRTPFTAMNAPEKSVISLYRSGIEDMGS